MVLKLPRDERRNSKRSNRAKVKVVLDPTADYCPDCCRCGKRLEWPPYRLGICGECFNVANDDKLDMLETAHRESVSELSEQDERDTRER